MINYMSKFMIYRATYQYNSKPIPQKSPQRTIQDTGRSSFWTMVRTYSSNKTNGADRAGTSGARPTAMERDPTAIEPTHDRIILAVTDTKNNNDIRDNRQYTPKQAETKIRHFKDSDEEGKRQSQHTRHQRSDAASRDTTREHCSVKERKVSQDPPEEGAEHRREQQDECITDCTWRKIIEGFTLREEYLFNLNNFQKRNFAQRLTFMQK